MFRSVDQTLSVTDVLQQSHLHKKSEISAEVHVVVEIFGGSGDLGVVLHKGLGDEKIPVFGGDEVVVHIEHLAEIFLIFQIAFIHEFQTLADMVLIVGIAHGSCVVIFFGKLIISGDLAETGQAFQERFTVGTLFDFEALVGVDLVRNNFDTGDFVFVDKEFQRVAFVP